MLGEDVFEVVADGPDVHIEENPHHLLGEPDILISVNGFDAADARKFGQRYAAEVLKLAIPYFSGQPPADSMSLSIACIRRPVSARAAMMQG